MALFSAHLTEVDFIFWYLPLNSQALTKVKLKDDIVYFVLYIILSFYAGGGTEQVSHSSASRWQRSSMTLN